mgnify:FL=1
MDVYRGLKTFGTVCPFLRSTSTSQLRQLSIQKAPDAVNRLSLAATRCPMMGLSKAFSSSAATAAPAPEPQHARGYASIAEQQAESSKLQRQDAAALLTKAAGVAPIPTTSPSSTGAAPSSLDQENKVFPSGRPTTALGLDRKSVV